MVEYRFDEFDFSAGFERLKKGFLGNQADHVPYVQQSHEFNMRHAGISGKDYYANPEKLVWGALKTAHDMGFDTPDGCWDSYNLEAEALGATLITFDDLTPAIDNVVPTIRDGRDLARLKPPVPGQSGRMGFAYDAAALMAEATGEAPVLYCCAPFTLATQIMTFESVVLGIKDRPAFIHEVMTYLVEEVLAPYINQFAKHHPTMTANCGDAVASLPFITEDMAEEFAVHYIARLRELTGGRAVTDNWWGDAAARDLDRFWRNKLIACPDYLKVQDPDLFKVGAQRAKDFAVAKNKSLLLGVSNNLLQDGPEEAIARRIHEYLEIAEPGGHSLLYLCNFSAEAPLAHVKAAVAAIDAYRRGERPWLGQHQSGGAAAAPEARPIKTPAKTSAKAVDRGLDEAQETLLDDLFDYVVDGLDADAVAAVHEALALDIPLGVILDDALIAAMEEVGSLFSDGVVFVPEMLLSARAMKGGLNILRPLLTKTSAKPKGFVMLATVQGHRHRRRGLSGPAGQLRTLFRRAGSSHRR